MRVVLPGAEYDHASLPPKEIRAGLRASGQVNTEQLGVKRNGVKILLINPNSLDKKTSVIDSGLKSAPAPHPR